MAGEPTIQVKSMEEALRLIQALPKEAFNRPIESLTINWSRFGDTLVPNLHIDFGQDPIQTR